MRRLKSTGSSPRFKITLRVLLGLIASLGAGTTRSADGAHPLVLELFQSQGCAACPPAEANFAQLAQRPDIIALNFAVTYWDRKGWKDTFSQKAFTDRQIAYVRRLDHGQPLGTPEVVINGRGTGVGADPEKLAELVRTHDRGVADLEIKVTTNAVALPSAPELKGSDLWIVRYDPAVVQVPIKAGENGGKTLPQRNIVHQLRKIARWDGAGRVIALPTGDPTLRTAILVQRPNGGPVVAAATTR